MKRKAKGRSKKKFKLNMNGRDGENEWVRKTNKKLKRRKKVDRN